VRVGPGWASRGKVGNERRIRGRKYRCPVDFPYHPEREQRALDKDHEETAEMTRLNDPGERILDKLFDHPSLVNVIDEATTFRV